MSFYRGPCKVTKVDGSCYTARLVAAPFTVYECTPQDIAVRIWNRWPVPAPNTSVPDMAVTAMAHRKCPSGVPAACTGKPQDSAECWERCVQATRVRHGNGPSCGCHIPHHAEQGNLSPVSFHRG